MSLQNIPNHWIIPDWPAPSNVKALFTTRQGGFSSGNNHQFASLNLGAHVNDEVLHVEQNRMLLRRFLPSEPKWLQQVHGVLPIWVDKKTTSTIAADAAITKQRGIVCAVMVADCLPVFLCDRAGSVVAVVHAGWRGLVGGIIEKTVTAMSVNAADLIAWLGPAIGPDHFEVGMEVFQAFVEYDKDSEQAFMLTDNAQKKWLADIFLLARQRLLRAGITQINGGGVCTYCDSTRFFSYRRDGETGRMAALIWLE